MVDFSDLLILMVVVWTAGKIFRSLKLPMIFGELIGGIIVGPALLNLVQVDSELIKIIAELGIFFLMLHSGLETNPNELLKAGKKSILISILGALIPLVLVYFIAVHFEQEPLTAFFVGLTASISGIPIIARLFKDEKLLNSDVAHLSVGAAIINDILALILFSVALNIHQTGFIEWGSLSLLIAKVIAFFGIVIYGGTKLSPYMDRIIQFNKKGFTLTLIIALLMGTIAEVMGLHMIIGAFLAGLFIREEVLDERVFRKIEDRIYGMSYSFFAPIFFASLAFHLDFEVILLMPIFVSLILAASMGGKFIGAYLGAAFNRLSALKSTAVGVALNSRGAVELIIASIGLEKGIINETTFSILILVTFVSTIASIGMFKPIAKRIKNSS